VPPEAPRIVGLPGVVGAGDMVRVSWVAPGEADELELLLLLDEGAREPLRLTESLPGSRGTWSWRVPNLPARSARLVLRWGVEGHEILGPPGPVFSISCSGATLTTVGRRDGELWAGEDGLPSVRGYGLSSRAHASWPVGQPGWATAPHEPVPVISMVTDSGAPDGSGDRIPVPCVPVLADVGSPSVPLRE